MKPSGRNSARPRPFRPHQTPSPQHIPIGAHAPHPALREEAKRVVLRDGDRTRYGVVQAITYVAHAVNTDPEVRFTMERLAGAYLAATLV